MSTIDTIRRCDGSESHKASSETGGLFHTISAMFGWFGNAMLKRRTRLHLSELSNDLLDDVGIEPAEARREIKRFFWD
ncbi:DUF1127 domain-containing protein [Phyllobacterium zundukense]|uniref:YjiS-like domain-containing protein n=1 Tax=Phyllobacterium zundukense TaxID=1867719 RepID=A0A2N9VVS8_9HYPH|nr:DUF1127 domain-containing protein [Phyllobacterium zundukense]ATU91331.1 hypothetical protein BLM14_06535 [Phyllobacterium zundukense]PIO43596.1 hypothetical protein B5P45_16920 [Phyllobacterium zundukense]